MRLSVHVRTDGWWQTGCRTRCVAVRRLWPSGPPRGTATPRHIDGRLCPVIVRENRKPRTESRPARCARLRRTIPTGDAMNGVHDMGGMHGFGPVVREENEPLFHGEWE